MEDFLLGWKCLFPKLSGSDKCHSITLCPLTGITVVDNLFS